MDGRAPPSRMPLRTSTTLQTGKVQPSSFANVSTENMPEGGCRRKIILMEYLKFENFEVESFAQTTRFQEHSLKGEVYDFYKLHGL